MGEPTYFQRYRLCYHAGVEQEDQHGETKTIPETEPSATPTSAQARTANALAANGGLIVLAVAAFAVVGFYRASSAPEVDAPLELMQANIDGLAEAPVRIVEFGDFGCPSCRAWHNSGIKEALLAEFGDQVSFTFRHFPVITRQSPKAAEAGQCASEQGRFWDYHDYIYESTPQNALAVDQLKNYANAYWPGFRAVQPVSRFWKVW